MQNLKVYMQIVIIEKKKKKKKTTALKFSVKLSSTNMGFVNYSSLTLSPDFQNTERLSRGVLQK